VGHFYFIKITSSRLARKSAEFCPGDGMDNVRKEIYFICQYFVTDDYWEKSLPGYC